MVPITSAGSRSGVNWIRENDGVNDLGQGPHGQRLGETGHAFEQDVSAGEQSDQQPLHHDILSHDALGDLGHYGANWCRINGAWCGGGGGGRARGHGFSLVSLIAA